MQNDAGGIGLFRSEFIYLEQDHYPTEEEQFRIYKQAAETMAENASSSVPSISVLTNSAIISRWKKRRIRHLAAVRSASA